VRTDRRASHKTTIPRPSPGTGTCRFASVRRVVRPISNAHPARSRPSRVIWDAIARVRALATGFGQHLRQTARPAAARRYQHDVVSLVQLFAGKRLPVPTGCGPAQGDHPGLGSPPSLARFRGCQRHRTGLPIGRPQPSPQEVRRSSLGSDARWLSSVASRPWTSPRQDARCTGTV
jgi:hypothetical protein